MGSTHIRRIKCTRFEDHPHIHGEHLTVLVLERVKVGSPPYTWGARSVPGRSRQS